MTGSCAQRRHWSLLRAWTARSLAIAGVTGGAWLLGAGLATASTPQPHLSSLPAATVAAPALDAVARESVATETTDAESGPATPGDGASPVATASTDTAAANVEPAHDETTTTADTGPQRGVADLVTGIASDVHSRLDSAGDPEVTDPIEPPRTAPDADAPHPADPEPDTARPAPPRSRPGAPQPPAPPPAPAAEPATVESEHLAEGTGTDHATQDRSSPAHQDRGDHRHPVTSTPHPVPPLCPPTAPVATATATPTGPGHGLRWMHVILPTRPCLPDTVRAAGGHVETVALRGVALIEPSASPD